ncbi:carboxylesterase family protein [Corynebacterium glyciniphilum]|uniref:carboxylesterase family protein n=1 Tax=Corynebacterium glyciniphilum TaxID=1404244 RepID=UPI0011AB6DB7|nr:carboxylesterase family protein [Corynebacterium glyciniphilum]
MRTDPATGVPLLRTPSGDVSGSWRNLPDGERVAVFRAVPVAAPHAEGPAAFAPPRPAPAWSGTVPCGDTAERRGMRATHTVTVTCPAGVTDRTHPVMVWVHGGRFETGHADEPWYDGAALAREGCVVVSLNYRRRFEGFLPLGSPPDRPDFRGVDDLLLGLRWVRECIAEVGGDPGQVTLAGQSAGGALVAWLLTDPRAEGLFHRAVMMSPGAPRRGWTRRRLTTRLALRSRHRPTVERMGALSAGELTSAYRRFARLHATDCAVGVYPFSLTQMRPVPAIVGTMHDEFVRFPGVRQVDAVLRRTVGRLGLPRVLEAWLVAPAMAALGVPLRHLPAWCRSVATTRPVRPLGRTVGDRTIRRWASAFAEALAEAGAPVWAYEFRGGVHPAQHCAELPLLFDTLTVGRAEVEETCGPEAERRLGGPDGVGAQFRSAVVAFIHGRQPDWGRFRRPTRRARIFDMPGVPAPPTHPRLSEDPWRAVRTLLGPLYTGRS